MISTDSSRIDLVLQYALLVAGEQDEKFDRQLGPIHLLKYVYLADLYHAEKNEGATYTGIKWRFYKFGPWSQTVNERIEPALSAIGADKKSFPSNYEENQDQIRWSLQNEHLLQERERQLPGTITFHLRRNVLQFGKDTQSLLYYVYNTKPMLNAAPGEYLDFTVTGNVSANNPAAIPLRMDSLSNRKKKQFKERMRALRVRHKNKRKEDSKLIKPVKNPRYDDVYHEGIAWLDSLAGPQFAEGEYTVEFSDEVWKSATRKSEDVS